MSVSGMITVSRRAVLSRVLYCALLANSFAMTLGAGMPDAVAQGARTESAWDVGVKSRARLVAGPRDGATLLAGLEIRLDPGAKTYWRNPGDSGLSPQFDWKGSENVAAIEVLWPAPSRLEDATGGVIYGYKEGVIVPLRITAKEPDKPVRLRLAFEYGVCKDICIPASAVLHLDPPTDRSIGNPALLLALNSVPERQESGMTGPLAFLGVERIVTDESKNPEYIVVATIPEGSEPVLFPEVPDGWHMRDPGKARINGTEAMFVLSMDAAAKTTEDRIKLRLTLTAGDQAVETEMMISPLAGTP